MTDTEYTRSAEEILADEIVADFNQRQTERKAVERGWQLNMNFTCGNQYCDIDGAGEIVETAKRYFWQGRAVFNHIAPVIDTRLSKLSRIRPALRVRAASDDEKDRHSAKLSSAILVAAAESIDLDGIISTATMWSEVCGTAFYKIIWNAGGGNAVGVDESGAKMYDGDIKVVALSPFEIYPFSLSEESLAAQPSIMHAKALPVQDIFAMYGVKLAGRDIDEFSLSPFACANRSGGDGIKAVRHGYELVIERYERPTAERPDGRLCTVAGGKLVYDGPLPYLNGTSGERGYPFVKQISLPQTGSFFGGSVVDRLIPVQRAFNAVKNRKQEFLNRISMGTVAVEDGAVDVDELSEDGLTPGKIIVYRQGAKPPEMLSLGGVPSEFWKEEENLLSEFKKISGTSDLSENSKGLSGITSATGLQLIIEQDDARLSVAYDSLKRAVKEIGRHILRLYRQFAGEVRLMRYAGENNALELFYFKGSDISSDDVVLEADSDLNMTAAQRRTVIYEIIDRGLFSGSDGKLTAAAKNKLLEMLGFGSVTGERDLGELNRARAGEENLKMRTGSVDVKDYDDHETHITEHTAFLLTEKLAKDAERRICAHIARHRQGLDL